MIFLKLSQCFNKLFTWKSMSMERSLWVSSATRFFPTGLKRMLANNHIWAWKAASMISFKKVSQLIVHITASYARRVGSSSPSPCLFSTLPAKNRKYWLIFVVKGTCTKLNPENAEVVREQLASVTHQNPQYLFPKLLHRNSVLRL